MKNLQARAARYFRKRRMDKFYVFLGGLNLSGEIRIADFGGRPYFWASHLTSVDFDKGEYDVVFSNSTIEHLGGFKSRKQFVRNIGKTSPRYFVQVPNYWFPYEPHYRRFLFQYFPRRVQIRKLMKENVGFFLKAQTQEDAEAILKHNRLLTFRELRELFPGATIEKEYIWPFIKSFIAVKN